MCILFTHYASPQGSLIQWLYKTKMSSLIWPQDPLSPSPICVFDLCFSETHFYWQIIIMSNWFWACSYSCNKTYTHTKVGHIHLPYIPTTVTIPTRLYTSVFFPRSCFSLLLPGANSTQESGGEIIPNQLMYNFLAQRTNMITENHSTFVLFFF